MFHEKIIRLFLLLLILSTIGCGLFRPKPTEVCHHEMEVHELGPVDEFDKAAYLEIAIEVGKDLRLAPAMFYDSEKGVVTFGKKELTRLPGVPMVVYVVIKNNPEKICFNAFPYDERTLVPNKVNEILEDFKNEIRDRYIQRQRALKDIYERYQKK